MTKADEKKLKLLEKLKEEGDLTPQVPVRRHMYLGYSYVRPAGEAQISLEKTRKWIQDCGLSDLNELENVLTLFQQNHLIPSFNFSEQDRVLKIQFPKDFEERYNKYKEKLYNDQQPTQPASSTDFNSTRVAQTKALERSLAQGEHDDKLKKEIVEELESRERTQNSSGSSQIGIKVTFDSLNGVLRFGHITHSFHRGSSGEEKRLVFFRKLWEEKRFIKSGVVKINGTPLPPETLAVQLEIINYSRDFNTKTKNQLFSMVKGINRILKDKAIPAYIERQNGIQLIITEK